MFPLFFSLDSLSFLLLMSALMLIFFDDLFCCYFFRRQRFQPPTLHFFYFPIGFLHALIEFSGIPGARNQIQHPQFFPADLLYTDAFWQKPNTFWECQTGFLDNKVRQFPAFRSSWIPTESQVRSLVFVNILDMIFLLM